MKTQTFLIVTAALALTAGSSFARPGGVGAGLGMAGPPASVTMGPPAAAMSHIPTGVPLGQPSVPQGAAARTGNPIGGTVSGSATARAALETPETDASFGSAAAMLGKLNAAHASPTALENASPRSVVGAISAYKSATVTAQAAVTKYTALVSQDQASVAADKTALASAQASLTTLQSSGTATPQQLAAAQAAVTGAQATLSAASTQLASDQASLSSSQAAIVSAQNSLSVATNKTLTPSAVTQLNTLLGI